jgi:hypothetical protein
MMIWYRYFDGLFGWNWSDPEPVENEEIDNTSAASGLIGQTQ